jgi:uncharacterized protein YkwD
MRRAFRPAVDNLDARRLMAAHVTANLAHGVLTVNGTPAADIIAVNLQGGTISVEGIHKAFRAAQVKRIDVFGGKGDDTISVQVAGRPSIEVRINGGAGNDTINGVPESAAAPVSIAPPVAVTSTTNPPVSSAVQRIIDLTNAQRINAGLAPLAANGQLMQAAAIQSGNMARLGIMDHFLPGTAQPNLTDRAAAVGYQYSTLGENIAFNFADADAVVAGWMGSPGHRANILNANFTQIGVSIALDAKGEPYYTQVFGRPG